MIQSGRQILGNLIKGDPENFKDSVFINRGGAIQYMLQHIMVQEEENENFTGYLSSLEEEDYIDGQFYSEDERVDNFKKEVEDSLFVFSYRPTEENEYPKIQRASLVPKPPIFDKESKFYQIPVFASKEDEITNEWALGKNWKLYREFEDIDEFIYQIEKKESMGSVFGFDAEIFSPGFVLWKDSNMKLYAVGNIEKMSYDERGALFCESSKIAKLDISKYLKCIVYDVCSNPTISYIPDIVYTAIMEELEVKEQEIVGINSTSDESMGYRTLADVIVEIAGHVSENNILIPTDKKNDELIIQLMDYYSRERDLYYSVSDFVNIHTAIKCSNLVIISGLSGTGKSQMVEVYARAIGIDKKSEIEDKRLLFIPVRPAWNDDSDLLGYVDLVKMMYRPSDTGFIDMLIEAQKPENKEKMYIVCFDEMNLARVEHYFSQFLSILERPTELRELRLYDDQYVHILENADKYPSTIKIGDNIRFIGTVNIDETTYHFSDKVLDRANVIQLNVIDYSKNWIEKKYLPVRNVEWTRSEYNNLIVNEYSENEYRIRCMLWDIHKLMQSASSKFGVGPRIVKSISRYIANVPAKSVGGYSANVALDYQILQRIMTKVRGPEHQLGDILKEDSENNFYRIFDNYSDISQFSKCREIVSQKQKELETYGYCI